VTLQGTHSPVEHVHLPLPVIKLFVSRNVIAAHDSKDTAVVAIFLPRCVWRIEHLLPMLCLQNDKPQVVWATKTVLGMMQSLLSDLKRGKVGNAKLGGHFHQHLISGM
jgi:hypothetical protein